MFVPRSSWKFVFPGLLVSASCSLINKDAKKCEEALRVTREAVNAENFSAASTWREYAYKQCDEPGSLASLDQEITAAQSRVQLREQAAAERRQQTRDLLKVFLGLVAGTRAAPERASAAPSCDPPAAGDPKGEQSQERFCTGTRSAGTHPLLVRYWAAEPAIARYTAKLPDATTCAELGAANVLKTWSVAATDGRSTERARCEFTSGPLAGLHAVVSQAVNADLYVFNPAYLDREPSMRSILEGL